MSVGGNWVLIRRPAPPLRPFIRSYIGYESGPSTTGFHRGLPSPFLTFVIGIDDGIEVTVQSDPRRLGSRYASVLGGLQITPTITRADRSCSGLMIELAPFALNALSGVSAGELWNCAHESADVLGPFGRELVERLQTGPWERRFHVLDALLVKRFGSPPTDTIAIEAWRQIVRCDGRLDVAGLAAALSCSRQHLARSCRAAFGIAPKELARVARLAAIAGKITTIDGLARAAAEGGFADQSHLTREFTDLAGCTPARYLHGE